MGTEATKNGWSYKHGFGIINIENWGNPFLIVTENKFWNGQSWGYSYYKLREFNTTEEAKTEANRLNSDIDVNYYYSSEESQNFLLSLQSKYPQAKIAKP